MEAGSEASLLGIPIPIREWPPRDLKSLPDTVQQTFNETVNVQLLYITGSPQMMGPFLLKGNHTK